MIEVGLKAALWAWTHLIFMYFDKDIKEKHKYNVRVSYRHSGHKTLYTWPPNFHLSPTFQVLLFNIKQT